MRTSKLHDEAVQLSLDCVPISGLLSEQRLDIKLKFTHVIVLICYGGKIYGRSTMVGTPALQTTLIMINIRSVQAGSWQDVLPAQNIKKPTC